MTTLLIDAHSLGYQALYSTGQLRGAGGEATGVIFGVLNRLFSLAQLFKTNRLAFFWESVNSLRKELYPNYKKGRHAHGDPDRDRMRQLALAQFDALRDSILPRLGFPCYSEEGFEADDLIAMTCLSCSPGPFVIITADEDLLQCVCPSVSWYNPTKKKWITVNDFPLSPYRHPSDVGRIKAWAGCPSDNIKGIDGVGPITAAKYLSGVLQPDTPHQTVLLERIRSPEGQALYELNRKLVRLPFSGCPEITLDFTGIENSSAETFREIATELEMPGLAKRAKDWERVFLRGESPEEGEDLATTERTTRRTKARDIIRQKMIGRKALI